MKLNIIEIKELRKKTYYIYEKIRYLKKNYFKRIIEIIEE